MRFRTLNGWMDSTDLDLDLVPNQDLPYLPPCVSCKYVSLKQIIPTCGHVLCNHCAEEEFIPATGTTESRNDESGRLRCSVCDEVRSTISFQLPLSVIKKLHVKCPCGRQGALSWLKNHASRCVERKTAQKEPPRFQPNPPYDSSDSDDPTSTISPTESEDRGQDTEVSEDISMMVIREEINRLKEDVDNSARERISNTERTVAALSTQLRSLETRVNVVFGLQNRLSALESKVDETVDRVTAAARQMSVASNGNEHDCFERMINMHAQTKFLWFNVKDLLRDFNRTKQVSRTESQHFVVGGYPLAVFLSIDYVDGHKMVTISSQFSDQYSNCKPDLPMRRKVKYTIFKDHGEVFASTRFDSTCTGAIEVFSEAESPGSTEVDLCYVRVLCRESFYQRYNGMVRVAVELEPLLRRTE